MVAVLLPWNDVMISALNPTEGALPSAVSFVSRLRGATQPVIVLTTGLKFCVAKFRDFTGRHGLLAEAVGAGILSAMGLPVPKWTPIRFTDEFLDEHPKAWLPNAPGRRVIRPRAGLHFGSRLMTSANGEEPYPIIPTSWVPKVENRRDFVGVLLADLWMNNCDRRQAVYVADVSQERLRAVFIDNDWAFGGYRGDEKTTPRRAMIPFAGFYDGLWTEANLDFWKKRLARVDETRLDAIFDAVPGEWADADSIRWARSQLSRRRLMLDSLIDETADVLREGRFVAASAPRSGIEEASRRTSPK